MLTKNVLESFSNNITLMARAFASSSTTAPSVLLNKSIPLCKVYCCQRRSTPFLANFMPIKSFYNTISISPVVLKEDFHLRKEVYLTFSLIVNDSIIRKDIEHF